ncbi:15-hydroxyprostaglandin dehydrogenase, putative [Paecilomyces variotii No. 5]|uniref:15-hydroxyprostaglandin dehydrogenase, putative n=1 Tax=Byssochlamys spectabilis (strain No. 5 / NBRC 109023) TaxID=1356009 RepID=V5FCZ0_BYSSN|nr:15-hydroxyprostaglandin dehydrogenase, putative [Paecilomyces variotii No. 5]
MATLETPSTNNWRSSFLITATLLFILIIAEIYFRIIPGYLENVGPGPLSPIKPTSRHISEEDDMFGTIFRKIDVLEDMGSAGDEAWNSLLIPEGGGYIFARPEDPSATEAEPWGVTMFHSLHCLSMLRKLDPSLLSTLKDKVVVLTGGATGIGRSAVEQFHASGAKVVFGDVVDEPAQELASTLGPSVQYVHCDTTSYADQLALFATAEKAFGQVDIVVANAGIGQQGKDIFTPDQDVNKEPALKEIDVNLKGAIFTARIGMHYLRKVGGGDLVLLSSIAGFKETGGLTPYMASKHGVIGLLRGLRITATPENIRINCICPWMTKTRLVNAIEGGWYKLGLPTNEPADVARAIIICATANRGTGGKTHGGAVLPFAGKILYISGGKSYEIEDKLQELEPVWLGKENSEVLAKGQAYLHSGVTSWDALN